MDPHPTGVGRYTRDPVAASRTAVISIHTALTVGSVGSIDSIVVQRCSDNPVVCIAVAPHSGGAGVQSASTSALPFDTGSRAKGSSSNPLPYALGVARDARSSVEVLGVDSWFGGGATEGRDTGVGIRDPEDATSAA